MSTRESGSGGRVPEVSGEEFDGRVCGVFRFTGKPKRTKLKITFDRVLYYLSLCRQEGGKGDDTLTGKVLGFLPYRCTNTGVRVSQDWSRLWDFV